jgi:outer membrane immunogenic protein
VQVGGPFVKKTFIVAAALLGLACPAIAADPAADVVVLDENYNWSGVYVGVQAGYGWGDNDYAYDSGLGTGLITGFDSDGLLGGLTAGANWQNGAFVYGVEADISYSDVDGSFQGPNTGFIHCTADGCTSDIEWFGTGRVRLGYAIDNFLPYITGGFAVGRLEGTADTEACEAPVCGFDETEFGWTAGVGVEWGLTPQISVKAEYLHLDFSSPDFSINSSGFVSVDDISLDTVRIGLNYRFGQ